jgi:hypothetical protein
MDPSRKIKHFGEDHTRPVDEKKLIFSQSKIGTIKVSTILILRESSKTREG